MKRAYSSKTIKRMLKDVVIYPVLNGDYRAYIKNSPALQAWGITREKALKNLEDLLKKAQD